jgi:hypothetical protein
VKEFCRKLRLREYGHNDNDDTDNDDDTNDKSQESLAANWRFLYSCEKINAIF